MIEILLLDRKCTFRLKNKSLLRHTLAIFQVATFMV